TVKGGHPHEEGNRRARPAKIHREGRAEARLGAQAPPADARGSQREDRGLLPRHHAATVRQIREVTLIPPPRALASVGRVAGQRPAGWGSSWQTPMLVHFANA